MLKQSPKERGPAENCRLRLPSRRRFWLYLSLTVAQLLFITLMSAQAGEQSQALSDWVAQLLGIYLKQPAASETALLFGLPLRKYAHLTEYAVLACFLLLTLRAGSRWPLARLAALAFAGSYLFACLDELHQRFVPGRTGQFRDTLIDGAGICLGLAITASLLWLKQKNGMRRHGPVAAVPLEPKPKDTAE